VKAAHTATKLMRVFVSIAIVWYILLGIAAVTWRSWIQTPFALVVLLLFFAPKLTYLSVAYYILLFRTQQEMGAMRVPVSSRPVDEPAIHEELSKVDLDHVPPWVKENVDDWLATDTEDEKDRKRAALLDRLYSYAASSADDYAARSAVNQLRLAINPWVKD
jgi:hypothetical protein